MNGSVMPLAGISWRFTAMLIAACPPNISISAESDSRTKGSGSL